MGCASSRNGEARRRLRNYLQHRSTERVERINYGWRLHASNSDKFGQKSGLLPAAAAHRAIAGIYR